MSDLILVFVIASAFALMVTSQLAIVAGLVRRKHPWRALSGLLMPPLSLYWAHVEGMRVRGVVWLTAAIIYVATVVIAIWRG
jgi:hypothetical protein